LAARSSRSTDLPETIHLIKSPGLGRGFLFDGFRKDCAFAFGAAEQPCVPADESRERDAVAKPLGPGVGSANSEFSGQVNFAPAVAPP
jgi:hypothetical protein